jgi:hypothetical protein
VDALLLIGRILFALLFNSSGVMEHTPGEASATITVRAETGEAVTFEVSRAKAECLPEGTVYWDGPDDRGLAAAAWRRPIHLRGRAPPRRRPLHRCRHLAGRRDRGQRTLGGPPFHAGPPRPLVSLPRWTCRRDRGTPLARPPEAPDECLVFGGSRTDEV